MSINYTRSSYGYGGSGGNDVTFPPEMDDAMLDDRLEQARLNRTNFYRRMLASRTRPTDDYHLVSKKSSYNTGNSGSPARDTSGSEVPKIPEPHSSWRFYTSYDNGEWRRHAVPVDHDEEEILREPTKTPRRDRDRDRDRDVLSPSPVESSLRRMRQAGGPLVACLQPRPKRTSESSGDSRQVAGYNTINGIDSQVVGGQLSPEDLMSLCGGNADLMRQVLAGGGVQLVGFDGEGQPKGNVKQEYSSKYMSTTTVTQPNRSSAGGGGVMMAAVEGGSRDGAAKTDLEVRKSRRPRIYGFQEKVIIPTKYKTAMLEKDGGEGHGTTENSTTENNHYSSSETSREVRSENGALGSAVQVVKPLTARSDEVQISSRVSPGRVRVSPESQTVKVVVVNSGSDGETDRKPEEHKDEQRTGQEQNKNEIVEVAKKESGKTEAPPPPPASLQAAPFAIPEGMTPMEMFQAFQESFRKQFEKSTTEKKDSTEQDKNLSNPAQRVFSKDEQSFSEVGPDGQKRDGKVLQTYEVITTTDGEAPSDDQQVSVKEISITPVEAVRASSASSSWMPISYPAMDRRRSDDSVEIVREDSSRSSSFTGHRPAEVRWEVGVAAAGPSQHTQKIGGAVWGNGVAQSPLTSRRIVDIVRETGGGDARGSPRSNPEGVRASSLSPRLSDRKTVSIFDETGSLFKTLSPRPRAEREKDPLPAAPRDTPRPRDQLGSRERYITGTSRNWTNGVAFDSLEQPRRKVVIVRESESSDNQPRSNVREDSTGQGYRDSERKSVEIVREFGPSTEHPQCADKITRIFGELDTGTANQSTAKRTVEIVRETDSTTAGNRTNLGGVEASSSSLEGGISIGGHNIFASEGTSSLEPLLSNASHSLASTASESNSTQKSVGYRVGGPADLLDSQWEVQVAVRD